MRLRRTRCHRHKLLDKRSHPAIIDDRIMLREQQQHGQLHAGLVSDSVLQKSMRGRLAQELSASCSTKRCHSGDAGELEAGIVERIGKSLLGRKVLARKALNRVAYGVRTFWRRCRGQNKARPSIRPRCRYCRPTPSLPPQEMAARKRGLPSRGNVCRNSPMSSRGNYVGSLAGRRGGSWLRPQPRRSRKNTS